MDELTQQSSNNLVSEQTTPEQPLLKRQKWVKWLLILLPIIIVVIGITYFINASRQDKPSNSNLTLTKPSEKKTLGEVATRTYFKNNQPVQVLKEESKKNPDGSLETIVTKDGKKLSHHLYFKNLIFKLSGGILNLERFKSTKSPLSYLTTGENILKYVKQTPSLPTTATSLNGKKTTVYTIGGKKTSSSLQFIKAAFAQTSDEDIVKVYVDEVTGELKKVEQLPPNSALPTEVIEYSEGPFLPPLPITNEENGPTEPLISPPIGGVQEDEFTKPNISVEEQLRMLEELVKLQEQTRSNNPPTSSVESTATEVFQELRNETKEVKVITVDPSIVPNEAIYINPLSVIPTASGYNSPIMELSSKLFNQQTVADKVIKERGVFEALKFAQQNVKVRIDGVEVSDPNMSLGAIASLSTDVPWTISLLIPKGLSPGYHTVEVFMINSWYLAPNLLVTLPQVDEKVLEIELSINPPPVAVALPNNQGYRVTLRGNNFIKPFTVSLDNTVLDDNAAQVNSTEELVLTIPANIPPPSRGPAYDVIITKGSQKVFRPALLILGGPGTPL